MKNIVNKKASIMDSILIIDLTKIKNSVNSLKTKIAKPKKPNSNPIQDTSNPWTEQLKNPPAVWGTELFYTAHLIVRQFLNV